LAYQGDGRLNREMGGYYYYYYGKKLDNEVDGMLFKAVGGC
jgi:hypothetical protein